MKRWLLERGGLVACVALIIYVVVASPAIADGDSAEMVTLGHVGGVAHPSGYPLYLLWLRAWSWFPSSTAASNSAIATAILGALQILVLHAACRSWGARHVSATITVAIFAGAPLVLRYNSEAEVFAMNDLVAAAIIWLAGAEGPVRGMRRTIGLALIAGLGMSDHMSCTLLAPLGLVGAIRGLRESTRPVWTVAAAVAGLGAGLLPYLYLVATSGSAAAWGPVSSLDDLIGVITRRDYGGVGAFAAEGDGISVGRNLVAFLHTAGRTWLWLPAVAGVVMWGIRVVRGGHRADWIGLLVGWLAMLAVIASFNIAPEQLGRYIVERFHLLPALVLAIPIAAGIDVVTEKLSDRPVLTWFAPVIAIVATAASLPYLGRVRTEAVELSSRNLLRSLPDNAVLVVRSDDMFYGPIYLQELEHERPDVTVLSWPMLVFPWYRERLAASGLSIEPHASTPGPVARRVGEQVFATGRPLFAELRDPGFGSVYRMYPHGIVARVPKDSDAQPTLDDLIATNQRLFGAFDLTDGRPGLDDEYPTAIHSRYGFTWIVIAKLLAASGRVDAAQQARELAHQLGPQP